MASAETPYPQEEDIEDMEPSKIRQERERPASKPRPHATLFRIGLQPLIVHFHALGNGYMDTETMESLDTKVLKRTLSDTANNLSVREEIGYDEKVWEDLRVLFFSAVVCVQDASCERSRPGTSEEEVYDGEDDEVVASSALIVRNYKSLTSDVTRLITLIGIGRNLLTVGTPVQDLAAEIKVEEGIFAILSLCVRVTGRGFDSGGTKDEERRWQGVVNDFKRLLCTCLQFLNNLVVQNERRKLLLWVELFDSPPDGDGSNGAVDRRLIDSLRADPVVNGWVGKAGHESFVVGKEGEPHVLRRFREGLLAHMTRLDGGSMGKKQIDREHLSSSPFLLYIGKVGMDIKKTLTDAGSPAGATEIAAECKRRWQQMSKEEQKSWHDYYNRLLDNYREEANPSRVTGSVVDKEGPSRDSIIILAQSVEQIQNDLQNLTASSMNGSYEELIDGGFDPTAPVSFGSDVHLNFPKPSTLEASPASDSDYEVKFSAHYGAEILHQGKDDLLRRLEPENMRASRSRRARTRSPPPPPLTDLPPRSESQPIPDPPDAPLTLASEDEREPLSEEEDSDYDDPVPGDDGRGLLTDVPLILGPTEIEVLPMIIQSGIVPPNQSQPGHGVSKEEDNALKSMHTLRCHLLLAQDNGRNLIRELLIFVAAWDLREEELYFQLMTQIIEAILVNGLLPFSYHAFRESKDIISPAQAVIMKLLTHIFRRRQAETSRKGIAIFPRSQRDGAKSPSKVHTYPQKVDVHMVSFLLTEFRRHIIPQTCALIFLQGQIRHGIVSPEDFPLNLWDMERMYEGIYQYLEFFAILTEHERWKQMMADWEITSELVTLLEELDAAIPRATARNNAKNDAIKRAASRTLAPLEPPLQTSADAQQSVPPPVSIERPYDPSAGDRPYDPASAPMAPLPQAPPPIEDEPSDFEWRNLKKLAVLVLSSLVWKSSAVQKQLGAAGLDGLKGRGIRALLNCCKVDDYNPYIREHAIMALRFALEGNVENQEVVRSLEQMEGTESTTDSGPPSTTGLTASGTASLRASPGGGAGAANVSAKDLGNGRAEIRTATGVKVEVPREVLDLSGYETFVDGRGQVQLKKRDAVSPVASNSTRPKIKGDDDGLGEDDFM